MTKPGGKGDFLVTADGSVLWDKRRRDDDRFPTEHFTAMLPRPDGAMTRWQLAAWVACQVVEWNVGINGEVVPLDHASLNRRLSGPFLDAAAKAIHDDCNRIIERRRPAIERWNDWIQRQPLRPLRAEKRKKRNAA